MIYLTKFMNKEHMIKNLSFGEDLNEPWDKEVKD